MTLSRPGDRVWFGLWMMALNPITALIVIPLLMLIAGALLAGWLFIKTVELICRATQKPVTALPAPRRSEGSDKW